jgi:serine/threonine-protein kinase RsbW
VPETLISGDNVFAQDSRPPDAQHLIIPSDPAEARRVQDEIELLLKSHQFGERDIFSVKLALEEALVNAIKHGNQMDPTKKVRLSFRVDLERFEIVIADEGPGFNPDDVPDPVAFENLERPCGRGLLLMRHYMSAVTFHPPGNTVSMCKMRNSVQRNGHP